ncbi:hypothetical protein GQ43DRAFT_343091, partial [Delitschia confertaspora ATCC 74209]
NTFPLPELIYDKSLTFSSRVFLLGVLFPDQVFAAYTLASQSNRAGFILIQALHQPPLRLDGKLDHILAGWKVLRIPNGWVISPDELLLYSTSMPQIRSLGQIRGFAQV